MQFDMKTLIGPDDPIIAASARWAVGSHLPSDTLLVASVQLRRLYHVYTDLARAQEADFDAPAEKASRLVSLSVLTKSANRDLEQAAKDWAEECKGAGLGGRLDSKLNVWLSAIKLKVSISKLTCRQAEQALIMCVCAVQPNNHPDGPTWTQGKGQYDT